MQSPINEARDRADYMQSSLDAILQVLIRIETMLVVIEGRLNPNPPAPQYLRDLKQSLLNDPRRAS